MRDREGGVRLQLCTTLSELDVSLLHADGARSLYRVRLRSLQLRIPLRMTPTEATLTHTVTDYTRIHFAGSIPKGEGEVYNTTKVHRYQLPPP